MNRTYGVDHKPWGNLLSITPTKCSAENLSVTVGTNNWVTTSGYSYDAAGNMALDGHGNAPVYDAENRIKTVAGVNYTYDGDGRRVKKDSGKLYWTGTGSDPLDESDLSGNVNEEYVFFNGKRIARVDLPSGTVHYYFSDHLGTADVVTNVTGATIEQESDYYPYGGERVITAGTNSYKFTGKERDGESGLDNFGARFASSSLGRFMTPDWAERPTAVPYAVFGDPQSLNLYTYVRNDPVTRADADGHQEMQVIPARYILGWPSSGSEEKRDTPQEEGLPLVLSDAAGDSAQAQNTTDPPKQETEPGEPKKVVRTGKHVYKKPTTINGRKFEGTAYRYKVVDAKNNIVRGPMNVIENLTRTPQTQELPQPATWSTTNGQFTDYVGYWTQGSFPQNYFNVVDQNFIVTQNGVSTLLDTTVQQTVSSDANGNVTGVAHTIEQ